MSIEDGDSLNQGCANSVPRDICLSETLSRAHVVDSFLSLP